ncbi:hypothetical protein SAMN05216499_103308 [Actinacidiphila paucisporea]|uniref:Uncharacterized protein n=1 Tax=Actinacidiphila paucisporea TaxID=310782 RepID=A0A1M6ZF08_9ACTN|nr:hypothetical protein SAMN05216499_103308 [Actinacidiphila paucisporea]
MSNSFPWPEQSNFRLGCFLPGVLLVRQETEYIPRAAFVPLRRTVGSSPRFLAVPEEQAPGVCAEDSSPRRLRPPAGARRFGGRAGVRAAANRRGAATLFRTGGLPCLFRQARRRRDRHCPSGTHRCAPGARAAFRLYEFSSLRGQVLPYRVPPRGYQGRGSGRRRHHRPGSSSLGTSSPSSLSGSRYQAGSGTVSLTNRRSTESPAASSNSAACCGSCCCTAFNSSRAERRCTYRSAGYQPAGAQSSAIVCTSCSPAPKVVAAVQYKEPDSSVRPVPRESRDVAKPSLTGAGFRCSYTISGSRVTWAFGRSAPATAHSCPGTS